MKKTIQIIVFILITSALSCTNANVSINNKEITAEEAISIAKEEGIRLGYNLELVDMEVLNNMTPWDKHYPNYPVFKTGYYAKLNAKLKDKNYWAIHFFPKNRRTHGGDFCVFIDSNTGEIITVYRGA